MEPTWIKDDNGNQCSVEYWGSEQSARDALASLTRCYDCSDCYDCYGCSGCSRCSRCSGCSGCYDCYDCSGKKESKPAIIAPAIPDIHKAIYAAVSQPDALNMEDWHSCDTTHCRAGWAVHLAGEAGYKLERETSPVFAAMMIYKASGYEISPCRFFDKAPAAMEDMRKLAEAS